MAPDRASADDFEGEQLTGTTISPSRLSNGSTAIAQKTNAFTELMKPKKAKEVTTIDAATRKTTFFGRDGLGAYTVDPASFPESRVLYHNEKFTVIWDLYPKASIHLLILPRNPRRNYLMPQKAFDDSVFLQECREEEVKVRKIAADELRRRFGKYSASEQSRIQAMEADELPDELPPGRDWSKEIISGIHANPSMSHVHIHVLSRDMVSEPMKKRNHYLSFTTDFLVGLEHFPLAKNDYRRNYGHFPGDMHCWRCGKNFGNKMAQLKAHLEDELQEWVRE